MRNSNPTIEDIVEQAKRDVSALETQKQTLIMNIQGLELKRDNLSQSILDLESKHTLRITECQDELNKIDKVSQEKIEKANSRDGESAGKLSDLNQKLQEAQALVNSNEGLKKNLEIQTMEAQDKISKLKMVLNVIKEHLD